MVNYKDVYVHCYNTKPDADLSELDNWYFLYKKKVHDAAKN